MDLVKFHKMINHVQLWTASFSSEGICTILGGVRGSRSSDRKKRKFMHQFIVTDILTSGTYAKISKIARVSPLANEEGDTLRGFCSSRLIQFRDCTETWHIHNCTTFLPAQLYKKHNKHTPKHTTIF